MTFSERDLEELASTFVAALGKRKVRPDDPILRLDLDLALRLAVATGQGIWAIDADLFDIPWVVPVIRKALQAAALMPVLQRQVKHYQEELKAARKPAPKPKPKPKAHPVKKPAAAAAAMTTRGAAAPTSPAAPAAAAAHG